MKLMCALLIASVLGVTPASADPSKYEPKIIPKCKMVKAAAGGMVCAYTLKVWRKVLKVDAELVSKRLLLALQIQRTNLFEQQGELQRKQLGLCAANQNLLITYNNKLTQDKIDLDRNLQNERVKFRLGSPVAWIIAVVATSVLGGVILNDLTN